MNYVRCGSKRSKNYGLTAACGNYRAITRGIRSNDASKALAPNIFSKFLLRAAFFRSRNTHYEVHLVFFFFIPGVSNNATCACRYNKCSKYVSIATFDFPRLSHSCFSSFLCVCKSSFANAMNYFIFIWR